MFKRISRIVITFIGAGGGLALGKYLYSVAVLNEYFGVELLSKVAFQYALALIIVAICSILAYLVSKPITDAFVKCIYYVDNWQERISISDLLILSMGFLFGLLIAYLLGNLTRSIPSNIIAMTLTVVCYLLCPYICGRISWKRRADFIHLWLSIRKDKNKDGKEIKDSNKSKNDESVNKLEIIKIIDSSAAVDGRIIDICKTGFVDGKIVIPSFVINELSKIADSEDEIKRSRGRRGLDVLNKLLEIDGIRVETSDIDYDDTDDIDNKLIRLALSLNAGLITVNYNLNKAASLSKVKVLNINELTNSVELVLLPGDKLEVKIIKPGKEYNQGVAYLDNGTMIVVENGGDKIGDICTVSVTTMLQTSSGRMIFARLEN